MGRGTGRRGVGWDAGSRTGRGERGVGRTADAEIEEAAGGDRGGDGATNLTGLRVWSTQRTTGVTVYGSRRMTSRRGLTHARVRMHVHTCRS